MAWRIELTRRAERQLASITSPQARRIVAFLRDRVQTADDPRQIGQALVGTHTGYWRYRVGDYRLICEIKDSVLVVLVVEVGHRRDVYR